MNTTQFKTLYYFDRTYENVSESEFKCQLKVKNKTTGEVITGVESKINILEIGQGIADSQSSIQSISWEVYLNQVVIMLFNLIVYQLKIEDIDNIYDQDAIKEFFKENPFHEE